MKHTYSKTFFSLWKLQIQNYKNDIVSLTYGWFVTTFTLLVWLTFKDTNPNSNISFDPFVLASALGVSTIRNCMYNMTRTLYDFRRRGVFNRFYSTPISKRLTILSLISFNQLVNLVISLFLFSISMLYSHQRMAIQNVNWLIFIFGYILMAATCNLFAFIASNLVRNAEDATLVGNIFYYVTSYLLGLSIPYTLLSENNTFLWITYIIPQKYCLSIMQAGWIGRSDMSILIHGKILPNGFGYNGLWYIPYIVSFVVIIISIFTLYLLIVKKYEKGERKYKKIMLKQDEKSIIYMIEKAKSLEELAQIREMVNNEHKKE